MEIKIIKATRRNIKEIGKLMLDEFLKLPFNERVSFNSVIKSINFYSKIGKVYITLDKNEIIGIVIFKIEKYWEGLVIIIEDLAVKDEYKKQGVAKSLMDSVEDFAIKNKITAIYFSTNKKSSSVKFFQR
ncbi:MAG: GNAT family N-acetyltransferase [Nanoarchaeota archaeon]